MWPMPLSPSLFRPRLLRLLTEARTLRANLREDEALKRYNHNDMRMDEYNQLMSRTLSLLPDDPIIRALPSMPDSVLKAWGMRSPEDAATIRTESLVGQIIHEIEFMFPDLDAEASTPTSVAGISFANLGADEQEAVSSVQMLRIQRIEPLGIVERDFAWISDDKLREVLRKDYVEAQRAYASGAYKASALVVGSVIEGMGLDVLRRDSTQQREDYAAVIGTVRSLPKGSTGVPDWDRASLAAIVEAVVALGLAPSSVLKFVQGTADARDTIHPQAEVRTGVRPGEHEAALLLMVVPLVYETLARVTQSPF